MLALDAHRLSYRVGSRQILSNCSLHVRGPGLIVITGPSGAGKTSFLHILAGLIRPDSGRISITGTDRTRPSWIVQNSPLLDRRSARENVALGLLGQGQDWVQAQHRALHVMADVGIEHLADSAAFRLSGGERQRVSVARAMASEPPLLLADEPTASLDADSRDLVIAALSVAADNGATVIITTHDLAVAAAGNDRYELAGGNLMPVSSGARA